MIARLLKLLGFERVLRRVETEEQRRQRMFYDEGCCPDCGTYADFYEGPRGGCNVNVLCGICGTRWNVISNDWAGAGLRLIECTGHDEHWHQRVLEQKKREKLV